MYFAVLIWHKKETIINKEVNIVLSTCRRVSVRLHSYFIKVNIYKHRKKNGTGGRKELEIFLLTVCLVL